MKTLLLAIFAVVCLAGQAALAQAPLPKPSAHTRSVVQPTLRLSPVEFAFHHSR